MPAHFENGEKCDGSKIELALTQYRHNLKTVRDKTVKDFDAKEMYLPLRMDQSRSKSVAKFSVYIIFDSSHVAVSDLCQLGLRFQNLPFSKSAGKNCTVFV